MSVMKMLYIWEGPETFCITKGSAMVGETIKEGMVKHKGVFGLKIPVRVPTECVGQPKALWSGTKIVPGWQAVKIYADYWTMEKFLPDVNPLLMNRIKSLITERDVLTRQIHDLRTKLYDKEQNDRFKQRVTKDMDFAGKVRQSLNQYNDYGSMGYYPGFGQRWGIGQQQQRTEEQ